MWDNNVDNTKINLPLSLHKFRHDFPTNNITTANQMHWNHMLGNHNSDISPFSYVLFISCFSFSFLNFHYSFFIPSFQYIALFGGFIISVLSNVYKSNCWYSRCVIQSFFGNIVSWILLVTSFSKIFGIGNNQLIRWNSLFSYWVNLSIGYHPNNTDIWWISWKFIWWPLESFIMSSLQRTLEVRQCILFSIEVDSLEKLS